MQQTVKVSWSGGKDSTCAVLLHLRDGHKVKVVNYTHWRYCELVEDEDEE